MNYREIIKDSKRIVVKVGTSTLTYSNGSINLTRIEMLTRVLSDIMNSGKEVVLVTSGAIGVGVSKLKLKEKPKDFGPYGKYRTGSQPLPRDTNRREVAS